MKHKMPGESLEITLCHFHCFPFILVFVATSLFSYAHLLLFSSFVATLFFSSLERELKSREIVTYVIIIH